MDPGIGINAIRSTVNGRSRGAFDTVRATATQCWTSWARSSTVETYR